MQQVVELVGSIVISSSYYISIGSSWQLVDSSIRRRRRRHTIFTPTTTTTTAIHTQLTAQLQYCVGLIGAGDAVAATTNMGDSNTAVTTPTTNNNDTFS